MCLVYLNQIQINLNIIHRLNVSLISDVRLEFYKWDRDGDEYVTYDDILGFYGPNMPSRQALAQFDWDEDHKYSVSEMQAAFGFQPDIYGPPGGYRGA